jgi:hypothetical protein
VIDGQEGFGRGQDAGEHYEPARRGPVIVCVVLVCVDVCLYVSRFDTPKKQPKLPWCLK